MLKISTVGNQGIAQGKLGGGNEWAEEREGKSRRNENTRNRGALLSNCYQVGWVDLKAALIMEGIGVGE